MFLLGVLDIIDLHNHLLEVLAIKYSVEKLLCRRLECGGNLSGAAGIGREIGYFSTFKPRFQPAWAIQLALKGPYRWRKPGIIVAYEYALCWY
jgi:hypothetical protein